jgi:hypothetical protein
VGKIKREEVEGPYLLQLCTSGEHCFFVSHFLCGGVDLFVFVCLAFSKHIFFSFFACLSGPLSRLFGFWEAER